MIEEKKEAPRATAAAAAATAATPVKVLLVNGTCSEIFRSALENSVEDCVLQYPGDQAVYVAKSGRAIPIPVGNVQSSVQSLREPSAPTRPTTKSAARRPNSLNHALPHIGSARQQNVLTPSAVAANRMRQQLVPQKFSLEQDAFEETTIEQFPKSTSDIPAATSPVRQTRFSHPVLPTKKTSQFSYRDRQKNYRLSDLVMLGPEHYAQDFNLPRASKPRKARGEMDELERIKEDLFHRYLWTQKPQVSCRICPISAYTRSATFAM